MHGKEIINTSYISYNMASLILSLSILIVHDHTVTSLIGQFIVTFDFTGELGITLLVHKE